MLTLADTDLLLDLLREADDEPVSLDELGVVGVHDPAAALRALEEAGHAVVRIQDRRADRAVTCVRLAPAPAATPAAATTAPSPTARARPDRRSLLLVLGLLVLAVLAARR